MTQQKRIAVIGAGLSGLVAGFELRRSLPDDEITLFESGASVGGVIPTEQRDGFLLEHGADSFAVNPPGVVELCEDLGITDRLILPCEQHRRALICYRGRLVPVPEGFALLRPVNLAKIWSSSLFSMRGRLRLLAEALVPARVDRADESLESFALRRFGREAFDRLIQPIVAGIYTADPARLSMQATMSQFVDLERRHGGMIRSTWAKRRQGATDDAASSSGARYGQFRSFPGGMVELFDALVQNIGSSNVRTTCAVKRMIQNSDRGWTLELANGETQQFDAVLVALGAPQAAKLLSPIDSQVAGQLEQIPYASSAIALLGVAKEQLEHPADAFGVVVPEIEQRQIIAASFASRKFPDRAPEGHHLIRVFMGGAMHQDMLQHSDERLIEIAIDEMRSMLGLKGDPVLQQIRRWNNAMPQYHVGHCELRDEIDSAIDRIPNLELAGNGLHGVGIAFCVRTARAAANRLVDALRSNS